jgi:hypothetical protein
MPKVSIDVDEIKKSLKATALTAKAQLSEIAKKAQKDFSQKEVLKKIDQVVEIVKSQEFMKNPKVVELTKKIMDLSDKLEKAVTKNASTIVEQVKSNLNRSGFGKASSKPAKKKAAKKNGASSSASSDAKAE